MPKREQVIKIHTSASTNEDGTITPAHDNFHGPGFAYLLKATSYSAGLVSILLGFAFVAILVKAESDPEVVESNTFEVLVGTLIASGGVALFATLIRCCIGEPCDETQTIVYSDSRDSEVPREEQGSLCFMNIGYV